MNFENSRWPSIIKHKFLQEPTIFVVYKRVLLREIIQIYTTLDKILSPFRTNLPKGHRQLLHVLLSILLNLNVLGSFYFYVLIHQRHIISFFSTKKENKTKTKNKKQNTKNKNKTKNTEQLSKHLTWIRLHILIRLFLIYDFQF